ncbi:MAG: hypothetical protein ACRD0J_11510, partial [Acidimicrobiales bacterium]
PALAVAVVAFLVVWAAWEWIAGLVLAGASGLVAVRLIWWAAPGAVLARLGATPAGPARAPRAHNLLDGLCVAAGLAKPSLYVIDDGSANALVVATDLRRSSLVVTSGLLTRLSRIELEGALAHQLARVKSGAVLPATVAALLVGPLVRGVGPAAGATPDGTDLDDLGAVVLTRYPPGLAGALARIEEVGSGPPVSGVGARMTARLWLAPPGGHLGDRVEALRDL